MNEDPNYGANAIPRTASDWPGNKAAKVTAIPRQIGGLHYQNEGPIQHWDLVQLLRMDYYIGNATKYLARAHRKGGAEDYQKAGTYVAKRGTFDWDVYVMPEGNDRVVWNFCVAQDMGLLASAALFALLSGKPHEAMALINALSEG